ncbi:MAG TPA: SsrA-binding protein SmpB [Balneolales bacterium]|nr:SsrA-binding protein SmpB [Balneolales bacterium]
MSNDSNKKKTTPEIKNRKARHDYFVEETYEAGIVLKGTEVKSLRQGKASFTDSFAFMDHGEIYLKDLYIKEFDQGSYNNHDPRRIRKLLLKKSEIQKIDKAISQKGFTLIPLKIYFKHGYAKVLLGLARGKKQYDKRADIAKKDMKRELERNLKKSQFKI